MNRWWRVYSYFLCGAFGGLIGWFFAAVLLANTADRPGTGLRIVFGGIFGGCIGLAIATYEGFASRSAVRFLKFTALGLVFGVLAGAVALPAAQAVYRALLGAGATGGAGSARLFAAGTFAWLLFGATIGLGESLTRGAQATKGALGGLIGGIVGGLPFELARLAGSPNNPTAEQAVLAVSLTCLGGAIGGSIAFVTILVQRAWLEVVDGPAAGRVYEVTKFVDPRLGSRKPGIIGSDEWSANIYLPGDPEVLPHHARIGYVNEHPTLSAEAGTDDNPPLVNGQRVKTWQLGNGDRLQVGATQLIYRQKKGKLHPSRLTGGPTTA